MALSAGLSDREALASFEEFFSDDPLDTDDTAPQQDPQPTPDPDDNVPEDQEDPDPDDEPLAADAEEDGEGDEGDEQDAEDEDISSLGALAEYFEVEEEDVLQNLEVVGPQGQTVSVGEALESWRQSEGLLETRRTQLETEYSEKTQAAETEVHKHLAQLNGLSRGIVSILQNEYTDDRLAAIRMEDPEQWTRAYERRNELMGILQNTVQAFENYAEVQQTQSEQDMRELLAKENAALLEVRPEWRDEGARRQAMIAGQTYLLRKNFTQAEINEIMDHRFLDVIADAVVGSRVSQDTDGKTVDALRKRGLKKPSTGLRTTSRKDPENPANRARAQARARLKKSGDERLAARLIEDLI